MQKESLLFLFISECIVSSAEPKLQKNERNAKGKFTFSFHFRVHSKFGGAKVTESREQNKRF